MYLCIWHCLCLCICVSVFLYLFFIPWAVSGPGARRRSRIQNHLRWIRKNLQLIFFSIFNDFKWIFLAWGLGVHINIYCGCQKNSPFHFFVQITVIFQSQFLNLEPCLEPMTLLKIFKRQFLYFFNSENPSSCQQQWWNI